MDLKPLAISFCGAALFGLVGACTPAVEEKTGSGAKAVEAEAGQEAEPAPALEVKDVDAAAAAELMEKHPEIVVLDIRTPEEFNQGHIEGARNIDFKGPDFEDKVAELDKEKPYLLHCRSGRRSTESLPVFKKLGFSEIHHLVGGFNEWVAAGKPASTE